MKLLKLLLQWLRYICWLLRKQFKTEVSEEEFYTLEYVKDFPDHLQPFTLYVLGKPGKEWLAGMGCPCGCNELIELVIEGDHPRWQLSTGKAGKINLSPSIWRNVGCKSHFFLHDGKIKWVKNMEFH